MFLIRIAAAFCSLFRLLKHFLYSISMRSPQTATPIPIARMMNIGMMSLRVRARDSAPSSFFAAHTSSGQCCLCNFFSIPLLVSLLMLKLTQRGRLNYQVKVHIMQKFISSRLICVSIKLQVRHEITALLQSISPLPLEFIMLCTDGMPDMLTTIPKSQRVIMELQQSGHLYFCMHLQKQVQTFRDQCCCLVLIVDVKNEVRKLDVIHPLNLLHILKAESILLLEISFDKNYWMHLQQVISICIYM